MRTTSRTRTSTRVDVGCARDAQGATRVRRLASAGLLRARLLPSRDGVPRVALVQTAASLLSGDVVEIAVTCGPGARLDVVEVAGMIAHDVRGGAPARLDIDVRLAAGARLHWAAEPLVLSEGCDLRRAVRVELGAGAVMLSRDTLVLGRHDERCGRLQSHTAVVHEERELHVESLDTGDRTLLHSPVVAGDEARVLDLLALYGDRAAGEDVLQLAGPGSLLPVAAASLAAAERHVAPLWASWSGRPAVDHSVSAAV